MLRTGKERGFTLIELLAVIVIMGILAALLFPLGSTMVEKSRSAGCLSNLRQIGAGFASYIGDHNGEFPRQDIGMPDFSRPTWWGVIAPYVGFPEGRSAGPDAARGTIGHCPNHTEKGEAGSFSYVGSSIMIGPYSADAIRAINVRNPSKKILVLETHTVSWWPNTGSPGFAGKSPYAPYWVGHGAHGRGKNTFNNSLFSDFHVESWPADGASFRWYYDPES